MKRVRTAVLSSVLAIGCAAEAPAQGSRDVPIERDLQRERRIERRIERTEPPVGDPYATPDDPDGVVGFDGAPDIGEDDIEDDGPLAPGSPADADDD